MGAEYFKLILVGGIGRSGTSILAKALASTQKTEFFYEPPVFMYFLETLGTIDLHSYDWKSFVHTLIYKDLMKGALSGRALNLNRHDISSVYNYKSPEEIERRFASSFRQGELADRISQSNGVIKVLDAIYQLDKLQPLLPGLKSVVILRNPVDAGRSIKQKEWFSDGQLSVEAPEPLRLMRVKDGFRYPAFLSENEYPLWKSSSELERIAIYCSFHFKAFKEMRSNPDVIFVKYEDLTSKPEETFDHLLTNLNLQKGGRTQEILGSIAVQTKRDTAFENTFMSFTTAQESVEQYESLIELV